jgi:type IV pilus assembly protein PilB
MDKLKTIEKMPPIEQLKGRTLGRILIKMGILSRDKVHECLKVQGQRQGKVQIGQIFRELGLVDDGQLQMALAAQRGMEYVNLEGLDIRANRIQQKCERADGRTR